jgi:hypothetical protein
MSSIKFITFCNTTFFHPTRILIQAEEFPFTSSVAYSEYDFPKFFEKHKTFVNMFKKGYGCYIWKSYIIYKTLKTMKDDEILFYCDTGCHLNSNPEAMTRFHEYISYLKESEIVSFTNNTKVESFVKEDAIQFYYPEVNREEKNCYAGVMLIRKTERTLKMMWEWKNLCEQYSFIDIYPSRYYTDTPVSKGNDCDMGLFNLVLQKHKHLCKFIEPDEIIPENNDWSSMNKFPFHAKRDRPNN